MDCSSRCSLKGTRQPRLVNVSSAMRTAAAAQQRSTHAQFVVGGLEGSLEHRYNKLTPTSPHPPHPATPHTHMNLTLLFPVS